MPEIIENPKNFHALQIENNVDFINVSGDGPIDNNTPVTYHNNADSEVVVNNGINHSSFGFKKGKYIGDRFTDMKGRIYWFKISLNENGNPLISPSNYVSAPCPDFCSGGIKN